MSKCSYCRNGIVKLLMLRRGFAEKRTCCSVLLDAIETWSEYAVVPLDIKVFTWRWYDNNGILKEVWMRIGSKNGMKRSATLKVLRISEPDVSEVVLPLWALNLVSTHLLSGDTSSDHSFHTLENWLHTCNHDHTCINLDTHLMPERVIQITREALFLRENLFGDFRYACLSHCWGADGLTFKLVQSNRLSLREEFLLRDLPKTFQDAVKICARLNIEYLWIDALCIVQDDKDDWSRTAATMANIYRHAFLTIAATASRNSGEGCFRRVMDRSMTRRLQQSPGLVIREKRWPDLPLESLDLIDYPLLQRAWVFQERKMSTRMVHFTSAQLVWECQHYIKGEDGATIIKKDQEANQKLNVAEPTVGISAWQKTVEEYSGLELTFEEDRLPAIAAVVKEEMKMRQNDPYVVGAWKDTILEDISWRRTFGYNFILRAGQRPIKPAPSWSWASVKGAVEFLPFVPLDTVQISDVLFTPNGPPQMGGYSDASITLRGPVTEATFDNKSPNATAISDLAPGKTPGTQLNLSPGIVSIGGGADFDFLSDGSPTMHAPRMFLLIFIGMSVNGASCNGFLLQQRSDTEYERVGTCWCYCVPDEDEANHLDNEAAKGDLEKQKVMSYIDSLPIQELKII